MAIFWTKWPKILCMTSYKLCSMDFIKCPFRLHQWCVKGLKGSLNIIFRKKSRNFIDSSARIAPSRRRKRSRNRESVICFLEKNDYYGNTCNKAGLQRSICQTGWDRIVNILCNWISNRQFSCEGVPHVSQLPRQQQQQQLQLLPQPQPPATAVNPIELSDITGSLVDKIPK